MTVKLCIDPGHGMGNRRNGVYDPGAQAAGFDEADIALNYALTLKFLATSLGVRCLLTRTSRSTPAPLAWRARYAMEQDCDTLVSLHLNSADQAQAHGTEVLWWHLDTHAMAGRLSAAMTAASGLRNRGAKEQNVQVLRDFRGGRGVLVELGFISNAGDRAYLLDRTHRVIVCSMILGCLLR